MTLATARQIATVYGCKPFTGSDVIADCWIDRVLWVESVCTRRGHTMEQRSDAIAEANRYCGR